MISDIIAGVLFVCFNIIVFGFNYVFGFVFIPITILGIIGCYLDGRNRFRKIKQEETK